MFPLLIPLLGAGAGALLSKKDPLKGALMGGAMGFGGAALAPGLLGAGAAAGTAATGAGTAAGTAATGAAATGASGGSALLPGYFASEAAMPLATQAAGSTGAAAGAQAATPGLFGQASAMAKEASPILNAANVGMKLAAGNQQQPQASPLMPNNGQGGNTLNAIMQQGNQYQTALQQAQMARLQRRSQW